MPSHRHTRPFQPHKLTAPRGFDADAWRWILPYSSQTLDKSLNQNLKKNLNQNQVCADQATFANISMPLAKSPLVLEIGAGKGKHAMDYAQANPEHRIIAIERTKSKFTAFAKSLEKLAVEGHDLSNLYPVHADAIAWTVFALPPKCLSTVYLLYPNPEQSNPNQQWLNMPFFEFLLSRLQDDGQIIVASNIANYIDNAYQKAVDVWQLPTQRQQIASDSSRTHFEAKYLARGEICQQLVMRKPTGYQTDFDGAC